MRRWRFANKASQLPKSRLSGNWPTIHYRQMGCLVGRCFVEAVTKPDARSWLVPSFRSGRRFERADAAAGKGGRLLSRVEPGRWQINCKVDARLKQYAMNAPQVAILDQSKLLQKGIPCFLGYPDG
jgi:hypothetical protein